jgi:hypothetical protein
MLKISTTIALLGLSQFTAAAADFSGKGLVERFTSTPQTGGGNLIG